MMLASLYDNRWLCFGWLKDLGYFDVHQDMLVSNLFYSISYIETQMLTISLMHYSTEDKIDLVGIRYIIDLFKSAPPKGP